MNNKYKDKIMDFILYASFICWIAYFFLSGNTMVVQERKDFLNMLTIPVIAVEIIIRLFAIKNILGEENRKKKTLYAVLVAVSLVGGGIWDIPAIAVALVHKPVQKTAEVALGATVTIFGVFLLCAGFGELGIMGYNIDKFAFGMYDGEDFAHIVLLIMLLTVFVRKCRFESYEYIVMYIITLATYYFYRSVISTVFMVSLITICMAAQIYSGWINKTGNRGDKISGTVDKWANSAIITMGIIMVLIVTLPHMGLHGIHAGAGQTPADVKGFSDDGTYFTENPIAQGEDGKKTVEIKYEGMSQKKVRSNFEKYIEKKDERKAVYDEFGDAATYLVYRLYKFPLVKNPSVKALRKQSEKLVSGNAVSEVVKSITLGRVCYGIYRDNGQVADMLYYALLARGPSEEEREYWEDQLNYSCTREHMINELMSTKEFKEMYKDSGLNTKDLLEEPDEEDAWKMNIEILSICNKEREARGLDKLATREDLWRKVANVRVKELIKEYSHTRPDGTLCWSAYAKTALCPYSFAGENIAAGYKDAESVCNAWFNSPLHMQNIMGVENGYMATGYREKLHSKGGYGGYYCQCVYVH
ncbi:MAG: DUF4214 domain-containing protein [Lachnospiraceae bacterium]|nr:DUF4214 domain-containing protein [Lachnospiraceae bacterium]